MSSEHKLTCGIYNDRYHCDCGAEEPKPFPAKPAPAPLPEADETICARLLFACNGHPNALIPWPHRLLHDAVAHITAQARLLAECEDAVEADRELYGTQLTQMLSRAESAESRVAELEEWHGDCPGGCGYWKEAAQTREGERDSARARAKAAEAKVAELEAHYLAACQQRAQAEAKCAALEEAIEQSKNATAAQVYVVLRQQIKAAESELESARAECRERIEKLEKVAQYAEHSLTCGCSYISPDEPCTCGLKTARAAAGV